MAEARPEIDEGIVKCPICFETFTNPKSLPCLHTFCLECLSTYITKEGARSTGFPCPICRAVTVAQSATKNPELWAEQFPTNSVIMHVLEITKFREKQQFCDPCRKRSKGDIKAENWCKNCEAYLCSDCLEFHNSLLQGHCLVSVEAVLSDSAVAMGNHVTLCAEHEEKVDMFCCDHQQLACAKCIAIDHRRCDKVVTTKVFVRELQTTGEINKIEKELESRLLEISNIRIKTEQRLMELKGHKQTVEKDVLKFTDEIMEIFKKFQTKTMCNITEMYKTDTEKLQKKVSECELLKQSIECSRKLLRAAEICGGSEEIVSTTLKTTSDNEALKKKTVELEDGTDEEIMYEIDNTLIKEFQQNAKLMTNTIKINRCVNMQKCKAIQTNSFNAKVTSDKDTCRLTGVLCTNNDRILVCDETNTKLKLFNKMGTSLCELTIPDEAKPFALCYMGNSDQVLVSLLPRGQNKIAVVDIKNDSLQLSSILRTDFSCSGIAFADNIYVTVPWNKCIGILDSSGRKIKVIRDCNRKPLSNGMWHLVATSKSKEIIVSEFSEIYFFDYNGRSKRRIKNPDSTGGRGIDVDLQGNIYICQRNSSNIIQLSPNGSSHRVLLSAKDGIDKPTAISFTGKVFAVTEDSGLNADIVKIFEMKA